MRYRLLGAIFFTLFQWAYAQKEQQPSHTISIFGSPEYGFDPEDKNTYRDGFFHSAGFNYRLDIKKHWYIQPSVYYIQVLLSSVPNPVSITDKVHRLGIECQAGYYFFNKVRWQMGAGIGSSALITLAGVRWIGAMDTAQVHFIPNTQLVSVGWEVGIHALFAYTIHPKIKLWASPFFNFNPISLYTNRKSLMMRTGVSIGLGYYF